MVHLMELNKFFLVTQLLDVISLQPINAITNMGMVTSNMECELPYTLNASMQYATRLHFTA